VGGGNHSFDHDFGTPEAQRPCHLPRERWCRRVRNLPLTSNSLNKAAGHRTTELFGFSTVLIPNGRAAFMKAIRAKADRSHAGITPSFRAFPSAARLPLSSTPHADRKRRSFGRDTAAHQITQCPEDVLIASATATCPIHACFVFVSRTGTYCLRLQGRFAVDSVVSRKQPRNTGSSFSMSEKRTYAVKSRSRDQIP